jgi:hypothetical protein
MLRRHHFWCVSENYSQLVIAKKHLQYVAYSAIISTFSALTLGYVFVAREQYFNAFVLHMCDCRPKVLAGTHLRSGKNVTYVHCRAQLAAPISALVP